MKKIVIAVVAALALVAVSDASAQSYGYRRPKYPHHQESIFAPGIHFGYVHSGYRVKDLYLNEVEKGDGMNGLDLGLTMDFALIPETLFLHSGLDYVYQTSKPEENNVGFVSVNGRIKDHNLDIPIHLKYRYDFTPVIGIFAQLGPTLSFGMSSKMTYRARLDDGSNAQVIYNYYTGKVKTKGLSETLENLVNSQLPESKYKRMDVRLGGAVGATFFDILEASVGYQHGIVNKLRGDLAKDYKMRRGMFYLTVGVRF